MPDPDSYEVAAQASFAPRWVGRAIILLRSVPVQFVTRSIAILPTIAWIFICGIIPLGLVSVTGLRAPTDESTLIWLFLVFPFPLYSVIVVVRVRNRLRRRPHEDESRALVVLDEITVLGWGVTVAVTQLFRPLNRLFTFPIRLIVSSPRAVRWALFGLILISAMFFGWSLLPIKFVPWANQFGRGVVTTASVSGFFVMAGIVLLGLLVSMVLFFGVWAEMLVIGGGTAFGAVLLKSLDPTLFSFVADPLIAWARWTPAMARGLLEESSDFHVYLTGPGGVTPFGLISMAVVLHLIPLIMKKLNVAIFPGEDGLTTGDREERDNLAGWWLRVIATGALLVAPLLLCILNRATPLADPNSTKIDDGPLVALFVLAALGCFFLIRMFKTRSRSVERPNEFVLGTIVYTRKCFRE